MDEKETEKKSKFSSGLNIVMRLDELWKDTHKHSRNGEYGLWNTDLDRIWLELARDLKEEDEEKVNQTSYNEANEKFKGFEGEIADVGNFEDTINDNFKGLTKEDVKKRNSQYNLLMKKQLFLARLENELGKGTTYSEGDDDDFD